MDATRASGRKRILLVEDEPGYQELMETILSAGPFEMTACASFEEAASKMEAESFDLIISDINLPGMTGMQVLEKMKTLGRLEICPVVMCSSQFNSETKEMVLNMGAAGFIPKPYQSKVVLSLIKALLDVKS